MAVVNKSPKMSIDNTRKTNDVERVFRSQPELKTSTLFSDDRGLLPIVQQIKGMKWSVDYFNQLNDVNDKDNKPDPNLSPTVQKYHRINDLILYVQSPLSQDDPDNVTGEAYINAGILPRVGDAFKATLTSGREAIFTLSDVKNATYNLHQCYVIEYKLDSLVDDSNLIYNTLHLKTVKTYIYNKDYLLDHSAPIVLEKDYHNLKDLKVVRRELIDYYLKTFTNNKNTSDVLSLPVIGNDLYVDQYLENFFLKLVDTTDNNRLVNLTRVYVVDDSDIDYTIWDLLLDRKIEKLPLVNKDLGFKYLEHNPSYIESRNLLYLGVRGIIGEEGKVNPSLKDISKAKDRIIPEVIANHDTYVLSSYFYNKEYAMCGLLEKEVNNYLNNRVINKEVLDKLIDTYYSWSTLDQYYGIPILILLIKDFMNNTYRSI